MGAIANCVGIRKESLVIVDRIQKAFNFMCADLDFAEQVIERNSEEKSGTRGSNVESNILYTQC